MSIFKIFHKEPPPPPPPIYKRQPIASAAVVLTFIGMFVLGPIGAIYKGMTEELKGKADNKTVILLIEQIKENDKRQWEEIQKNREQSIQAPKNMSVETNEVQNKSNMNVRVEKKVTLTPQEFEKYMSLAPDVRVKYKKYLESTGKDVSGLPD